MGLERDAKNISKSRTDISRTERQKKKKKKRKRETVLERENKPWPAFVSIFLKTHGNNLNSLVQIFQVNPFPSWPYEAKNTC